MRISHELGLMPREVLQDQGREVSIFSEMKQVLHVQSVDPILRVVVNDLVGDEERLVRVRSAQSVDRETTGQTGNGTEQRLEGLGQMVRDEVFVDL